MKILHLISGGDVGGAKTHVLSLVAGLCRTQTVRLVCFTEGEFAADARAMAIPTTVIPGSNLLQTRKRILEMIRQEGFQVIHCHGARANMMGMLLRKKAGIPLISTVHSDYRLDYMGRRLAALTYGNINKIALHQFDAWVGVSGGMTELLISRGFDPQRIHTIYNGVDFSEARHPLPREEYLKSIGLVTDDNSVVFGIAARISPVKDMTTLVRAFAKAVAVCPNIRLAIAGEGEQEDEIRRLADTLCPAGSVCFAGWIRDTDSFYHALDVNLLTSLSETFPYALTEGARMGCATIASEVGGVPYLIDHEENGLLFTPQDVDTLAHHMILLAQDPQRRTAMGQALYEKTKREFSLDSMITKQISIYESILRRAQKPKKARDGVLICGAYGKGNCGDNAILSAIVSQLRHIDPDIPICALSRSPRETRQCAGIRTVYTFNVLKIGRLMRNTRLYISGGGTLMQDATSTRSLLYYLFSIRQAHKNGCRVMLYGCGVGPISRRHNRRLTASVLNQYVDVISVRDLYSREFLKELGVNRPAVHVNADPALLIDPPTGGNLSTWLRRCGLVSEASYLMLSVRPWPGFDEAIPAFVEAVEYAHEKHGLIPVLYAMEPARDEAAAKAIASRLHCPFLLLNAGIDGAQALALISRMQLVVSMRLHALIFAAGQKVPAVGVVYDPKVSGFLDYLGQKNYADLNGLTADRLKTLMEQSLQAGSCNEENLRRLRHLAEENELLAAELLKH